MMESGDKQQSYKLYGNEALLKAVRKAQAIGANLICSLQGLKKRCGLLCTLFKQQEDALKRLGKDFYSYVAL
jgi:hypothetical protein